MGRGANVKTPEKPASTRTNDTPKYLRIEQDIINRIASGELRPGDWIGSEVDLAKHYGVSRVTVRRATLRLSFDGRIEAFRGKGTFVARPKHVHSVATLRSLEEGMAARGVLVSHRLIRFDVTRPTERARSSFGFGAGTLVYRLKRLRLINDEIFGLECQFIPGPFGRELDPNQLENSAALALAEKAAGLEVSRMSTTTTVGRPSHDEAKKIGIKVTEPVLIREHAFWASDGRVVMYGRNIFTARYEFAMEWELEHGHVVVKNAMLFEPPQEESLKREKPSSEGAME